MQQPLPANSGDVLPGTNKAVLTLSSGKKVELDSASSETIQDGTLSIENNNGELIYTSSNVAATNTMTTPKGGQYQLTLSDGTRVWLNAASSITYPTTFTGTHRKVTITGEAYFEVSKNKGKPFIVKAGSDDITVVGTSFNVNAYPDEGTIKTSLLEGTIKIGGILIKPGQAYQNGKVITTNVQQDVAWKNGRFNFNGLTLGQAMRQISRWYNINVVYEKGVPNISLWGEMGRDLNLGQVLEILSGMEVRYRMEAQNLVILP